MRPRERVRAPIAKPVIFEIVRRVCQLGDPDNDERKHIRAGSHS
jgi:hypothetical protein